MELLFGPGIEPNHFNDDALGNTLDKIYVAGPKTVFSAVSLKAQMKEDITCRVLHGDTTARLMYGKYEHGYGLNVTHGFNKERRTDLKQFKVGLVVNEDGFPVMGDILGGNLDDKTWNKQLLENLPKHFTLEQLENVVYVADSAFEDSLRAAGTKLKFISRLPEIYNLALELTNAAFVKGKWIKLGQFSSKKEITFYQAQEFKKVSCEEGFVWPWKKKMSL